MTFLKKGFSGTCFDISKDPYWVHGYAGNTVGMCSVVLYELMATQIPQLNRLVVTARGDASRIRVKFHVVHHTSQKINY